MWSLFPTLKLIYITGILKYLLFLWQLDPDSKCLPEIALQFSWLMGQSRQFWHSELRKAALGTLIHVPGWMTGLPVTGSCLLRLLLIWGSITIGSSCSAVPSAVPGALPPSAEGRLSEQPIQHQSKLWLEQRPDQGTCRGDTSSLFLCIVNQSCGCLCFFTDSVSTILQFSSHQDSP